MKYLWTNVEEGMLIQLAALGYTNAEIAEKLGRTKSAVAHKRSKLFMLMPEEPDIKAEEPEEPDIKAEEPEEPDGEGTTELERELEYVRELLDEAAKAISANADILEKDMATMMERTNELSKEKTVIEDRLTALEKRVNNIAENLSTINIYLNLGPLYRLFHSFRKFREERNRG